MRTEKQQAASRANGQKSQGATTPQGMRRADLIRLITEVGRVPFERDTLYHPVTRSEDTFTVGV